MNRTDRLLFYLLPREVAAAVSSAAILVACGKSDEASSRIGSDSGLGEGCVPAGRTGDGGGLGGAGGDGGALRDAAVAGSGAQGVRNGAVRLRAPQCEGLVDTNLSPGMDPKAITVRESEPGGSQFSVFPRLYGVLGSNTVSAAAGSGLTGYACDHPAIGFPLIGKDQGPCNTEPGQPACPAELGQMCVEGRCRAYPMIEKDSTPTFAGVSFWDTLTPRIRFVPLEPGVNGGEFRASVFRAVPEGAAAAQCNPTPLDQTKHLGPDIGPDERLVDRASIVSSSPESPSLGLQTSFYAVQFVNTNGRYYLPSDTIPVSFEEAFKQGRTVHICLPGLCEPAPDSSEAACELGAPPCGTDTGGLWRTFPRSPDECRMVPGGCPETPLEFASEMEVDGLPLVVRLVDDVNEEL